MSALAMVLINRGHKITGSDTRENLMIEELKDQGVKFFNQQSESNIQSICTNNRESPLVVISSAIQKNNLELRAAKKKKLQIWHRSDVLAALIKEQPSIAVAGTHGKTTTSTIITTMLESAGEDPTALIGGLVPCYASNAHSGLGRLLVAEADESDGSLIKFKAELGVITNLELDHTDHYSNLEEIISTMQEFGDGCKRLLANYDCQIVQENIKASAWWSIKNKDNVDFAAIPKQLEGNQTTAELFEDGKSIGQISFPIPGLHNLSNIIAAFASCRIMGITQEKLIKSITKLKSPARRFEFRGSWKGRQVVDDYAHHPSEIKATLNMVRLMVKTGNSLLPKTPKRIIVVFQPHRYSRVKELCEDFLNSLALADLIFIAPIYSAGENPIKGLDNEQIAIKLKKKYKNIPIFFGRNLNEIAGLIKNESRPEDLVLTLGAGDINKLWSLLKQEQKKETIHKPFAA